MKISFISLVIAVIALGFSIFQFDKMKKFETKTDQALHASETTSHKFNQEFSELHKKSQEFNQELTALAKQNSPRWPEEEALYLLRLASLRLLVDNDVVTAEHLLNAADEKIASLGDPTLAPVREAIAKDAQALKSIKLPDIEGAWVKVGAMIAEVQNLPIRGTILQKTKNTKAREQATSEASLQATSKVEEQKTKEQTEIDSRKDKSTESQIESDTVTASQTETDNTETAVKSNKKNGGWRMGLTKSWHEMKDLIKIQRHTKPIEPLLPIEEQLLAKEHLILLLEQIRWSLVQRNATLYLSTIQETRRWLKDYFESNNEGVINLENQLNELSNLNIKPQLPTLQSQQRLHTIQNTKNNNKRHKEGERQ